MTRTHRTRRWRKAMVLALCVVYGLVLLHPTTPDAAVTPLEWVVIGTTLASFLFDQYRATQSGPDPTATAVIQNRRMLKELHARFDTFGLRLEEIARDVANIPEEVRTDIYQALDLYRLHEVNGLRTRIADCAELKLQKIRCDMDLDQLWTDYGSQTAAFFDHGGLTAIALPELYEFERWYLYVTKKDSKLRLRQLHDNYEAAVRKALTVGRLPSVMTTRSSKLKEAYTVAMKKYRDLDDSNCGVCSGVAVYKWVDEEVTRDTWHSRTNAFAAATLDYERQVQWYTIYKEVVAALLVFMELRLGGQSPHASWEWPQDRLWGETLTRLLWNNHKRTPTEQCGCDITPRYYDERCLRNCGTGLDCFQRCELLHQ